MITAENIHELAARYNAYVENGDTLCMFDAARQLMYKRKIGEGLEQSKCFAANPVTGKWDVPFALKP